MSTAIEVQIKSNDHTALWRGHHGGGSDRAPPDLAKILHVLAASIENGWLPPEVLADPMLARGVMITVDVSRVAVTMQPLPSAMAQ